MELANQVLTALTQNYSLESYKKETKVQEAIIRAFDILIASGHVSKEICDTKDCSNFDLIELFDTVLLSLHKTPLEDYVINAILAVDKHKQWFSIDELKEELLQKTDTRHSKKKLARMLAQLTRENKVLTLVKKNYSKINRVRFVKY